MRLRVAQSQNPSGVMCHIPHQAKEAVKAVKWWRGVVRLELSTSNDMPDIAVRLKEKPSSTHPLDDVKLKVSSPTCHCKSRLSSTKPPIHVLRR